MGSGLTLAELRQSRLGAVNGLSLQHFRRIIGPNVPIRIYRTHDAGFAALRRRDIDLLAMDHTSGSGYARRGEVRVVAALSPDYAYGIMFPAHSPLFPRIKHIFDTLQGLGWLTKIQRDTIDVPPPAPLLH